YHNIRDSLFYLFHNRRLEWKSFYEKNNKFEEKLDYGQDSNYGILLELLLFLPESDKKREA
ncbi:hypothetical protein, partial [Acidianus sp. RZ1]|uniref:hypothetical protein n=1 Tax=Acidianus sp. RZ1 TaxID=1540082 RepID=UPI001C10D7B4